MEIKNLKEKITKLVGCQENVVGEELTANILSIKVKDRSIVQQQEIEKLEEVVSLKLVQNRVRIQLRKELVKEEKKMTKKDFSKLAKNIVENVGGKDNINGLRHCITRLRFRLKDEGLAKKDILENTDGVISVVRGGGEYMVVIGNDVAKVYDAVNDILGVSNGLSTNGETETTKQNPVMKVLNSIVGAIMPALNFICAGGVLKGLLTILSMTGLLSEGDGLYTLVNAMGDAPFYFLPIILGYNFAKHLKGDPFLGLVIGAILCYPAVNGADINIFGLATNATYTSSFLPVIAITAVAVVIERFLKKYIPSVVSGFLVPTLTLLVVIPLGFALIGPVVTFLGNLVNSGMTYLLSAVPIVAGVVFGGFYQVMVLFGIHSAATSVSFMNVLSGNPDQIMAMGVITPFAQTGVVLAVYLKTRNKKLKGVALPAAIAGFFGITEPAIYGVTLPRIKLFVISCIGAALSGAFIMATGVTMYTFTGMGIVTFLGLVSPENPNFVLPVLAAVIGFTFSFVAGYLVFKDDVKEETPEIKELETNVLMSPVTGRIVPLTEVPDDVFASAALGQGIAVQPTEGRIVAPADGQVTVVMPSKHAIGLTLDNGTEVLIHVGIDTVNLDGQHYESKVEQGQHVKAGEVLLTFDIKAISEAGYNTITPIIITNTTEFEHISPLAQGQIGAGELLLDLTN